MLFDTCTLQYLSSSVPALFSTRALQYLHSSLTALLSTCALKYLCFSVHALFSTCALQYICSSVPVLFSTCALQYLRSSVSVLFSTCASWEPDFLCQLTHVNKQLCYDHYRPLLHDFPTLRNIYQELGLLPRAHSCHAFDEEKNLSQPTSKKLPCSSPVVQGASRKTCL